MTRMDLVDVVLDRPATSEEFVAEMTKVALVAVHSFRLRPRRGRLFLGHRSSRESSDRGGIRL